MMENVVAHASALCAARLLTQLPGAVLCPVKPSTRKSTTRPTTASCVTVSFNCGMERRCTQPSQQQQQANQPTPRTTTASCVTVSFNSEIEIDIHIERSPLLSSLLLFQQTGARRQTDGPVPASRQTTLAGHVHPRTHAPIFSEHLPPIIIPSLPFLPQPPPQENPSQWHHEGPSDHKRLGSGGRDKSGGKRPSSPPRRRSAEERRPHAQSPPHSLSILVY